MCLAAVSSGTYDPDRCTWWQPPPPPPSQRAPAAPRARGTASPTLIRPFFTTPERLQVASCAHWLASSSTERAYAVRRIRALVAGPRGDGRVLPDDIARETFDRRCAGSYAGGFLLYEIYTRAAAFQ